MYFGIRFVNAHKLTIVLNIFPREFPPTNMLYIYISNYIARMSIDSLIN